MASRLERPQFSREHRLGLVVYGGIALAIYMNGICQEFYNAVRGRGIYKLIKALTDADIVVDVISGTSAGGINGVLLSYALANSRVIRKRGPEEVSEARAEIKFEKFAEVWKESGDIQKLLFEKRYDGVEKASFFNGVGYYKPKIKQALKDRWNDLKEEAPEDDWFSEFGELDLFVTGTDLLGRIYQVFDNTGCVIDVKDHHAIFHLKYREHGTNSFYPDELTCEALAKLCQITSCFPVAFPPVTVRLDTQGDVDEKLVEWGKLKKNRIRPKQEPKPEHKKSRSRRTDQRLQEIDDDPGEGYRLHFVDGGVLDNRPFSYTIKEIYRRAADRPVFRKLFYVDPSPDRFNDNPRYKEMLKPNISQVALDSLSGMPRYESINNDLELIKEHNEKVRRYRFQLADIEEILDKERSDSENQDVYDQQKYVYLRTRLISLKDQLLPLIFLETNDFQPTHLWEKDRTQTLDKVAEVLSKPFTDPQKAAQRLTLLKRLEGDIRNLDIEYALRQHFFIAEYVYKLLDRENLYYWLKKKYASGREISIDQDCLDGLLEYLTSLIQHLNHYIKVLEITKDKLYRLFSSEQVERYFYELLNAMPVSRLDEEFPEKLYKAMLCLHVDFLTISDEEFLKISTPEETSIKNLERLLENSYKRSQDFSRLKKKMDESLQTPLEREVNQIERLSERSLLSKLLRQCLNRLSIAPDQETSYSNLLQSKLRKYFEDFEKIDTFVYPLDYLAGITEKQLIETYRISPEDAKLGLSNNIEEGKRLSYKLAGDSLNSFGGFFKKSWRANDILWGRMDGLNRIVEALITEDKIKNFDDFLRRQAKKKRITKEEYLDQLLDDALSLTALQNQLDQIDTRKIRSEAENQDYLRKQKDQEYLKKQKQQLKEKLLQLIQALAQESDVETPFKQKLLQEFVECLIFVGHLTILNQDLKDTMQTLIEEQLDWGQQKRPGETARPPKFVPIRGSFNSVVRALAVKELAKQSLDTMTLQEKKYFFYAHYKIGSETLDDIPKSELKKITLRLVRVLRDILGTWRRRSPTARSTFWNRLLFAMIGFIVMVVLEILVRLF